MTSLALERWVGPVCAFGETGIGWLGPHHCAQCAAEVERACQQFAEDVRAGKFDQAGFTASERRAQRKRVDPPRAETRR